MRRRFGSRVGYNQLLYSITENHVSHLYRESREPLVQRITWATCTENHVSHLYRESREPLTTCIYICIHTQKYIHSFRVVQHGIHTTTQHTQFQNVADSKVARFTHRTTLWLSLYAQSVCCYLCTNTWIICMFDADVMFSPRFVVYLLFHNTYTYIHTYTHTQTVTLTWKMQRKAVGWPPAGASSPRQPSGSVHTMRAASRSSPPALRTSSFACGAALFAAPKHLSTRTVPCM